MQRNTTVPRDSSMSARLLGSRKNVWIALFALGGTLAAPLAMADAADFSAVSVSVNEGAGTVTLTVLRLGVGTGTASVDYVTSDFSATAPSDYATVSGTLSWGDGDLTARTITIPIVDDAVHEADETFFVSLRNPQGLGLGVAPTEAVTIIDNDAAAPTAVPAPTLGGIGQALLAGLLGLAASLAARRRSARR